MTNEIRIKLDAVGTFTITLVSLGIGASQQSTGVTNTLNRVAAKVALKITTGTSPIDNSLIEVFLISKVNTIRDDNAGADTAPITIRNVKNLGIMSVSNVSNTTYYKIFDTANVVPVIGEELMIAVKNSTGVALNATASNFSAIYEFYTPEVQ